MTLESVLVEHGCRLDAQEFRERVTAIYAETHHNLSIDDLLCEPDWAKRYAAMVRRAVGCPGLTDFVILRTLLNQRKHSGLSRRRSPRADQHRRRRALDFDDEAIVN